MKRPDKYPPLDPRLPDLYGRIIRAAQTMRTARHAENEIGMLMMRMRMNAKAAAAASLADAEPVTVPSLTPDSAVSGVERPVLALPVREDCA